MREYVRPYLHSVIERATKKLQKGVSKCSELEIFNLLVSEMFLSQFSDRIANYTGKQYQEAFYLRLDKISYCLDDVHSLWATCNKSV